jgi:hypothetical protein
MRETNARPWDDSPISKAEPIGKGSRSSGGHKQAADPSRRAIRTSCDLLDVGNAMTGPNIPELSRRRFLGAAAARVAAAELGLSPGGLTQ